MGILLDGFWMLHHDIGEGAKKDAVLLALTAQPRYSSLPVVALIKYTASPEKKYYSNIYKLKHQSIQIDG